MKILNHQLQAIKIYKAMYRARMEFFDIIEKQGLLEQLKEKYWQICHEEKIDQPTMRVLKNLLEKNNTNNQDLKKYKDIDIAKQTALEILSCLEVESNKNDRIIITLSKNGDLRKDKFRYPIKQGTKHLKILQLLDPDYIETSVICQKIGAKNNEAVRKSIGTVNQKIKHILKLKHLLIESKSGCGYHINDLYLLVKQE